MDGRFKNGEARKAGGEPQALQDPDSPQRQAGGKPYYFRAVSANGRELPEGTEVIVIYSEDSACFVESKERFFDVLFEEGAAPETPAREADDDSWRA